ncbi:HAD family hydrolase [Microbacterium sp. ASV49]|uniref:HAD family hydrolase n=1 Tax=Microbacterium candidum TaxID=3041922 RepID=A0ABT7MXS7_9MICO|nr:HAD family hydrolase [Microbacterium sp. ASV49]MDL9979252.1 HAD family hydrolase [Microbacterium sp. ASV49]
MAAGGAPQLVIFDCDGVLVDSEILAARVGQRVLADLGCEVSLDEILERFVGASSEAYRAGVSEMLGRPLAPGWERPYSAWYTEAFRTELRAVPGIAESLLQLSLPTCVASNSGHARIRESLRTTDLLTHFDGRIFSAEDVERGKPEPDVYLWAAKSMGVAPAHCVVVEDSVFGVRAARAAGMRVFAYAGVTSAERLAGERTVIFESMTDLPNLIAAL